MASIVTMQITHIVISQGGGARRGIRWGGVLRGVLGAGVLGVVSSRYQAEH